ncbi:hypothetical protein [Dyella ginsengisoli]|uniref:hypothetical protein n=1 Tax=Dyella ginsengisoli TaxID=363848 RepID=UPI00034CF021|nr:hypothetical protein [Dyella ginsengisoli]
MTEEVQQPDSVTASARPMIAPGAFNLRPDVVQTEAAGDTTAPTQPSNDAPQREVTPADRDADLLDGAFFDESAHPGRYSFDRAPPGVEHSHTQELAARALLAAEQVPPEFGRYLSAQWNRAVVNPPTPEANAAAAERVREQLTRTDPEHGAETIRLAQQEVAAAAARNPAVRDWLEQSGMGNDPALIHYLANRARARASRAARRGQ